jgi:hypothetical protein
MCKIDDMALAVMEQSGFKMSNDSGVLGLRLFLRTAKHLALSPSSDYEELIRRGRTQDFSPCHADVAVALCMIYLKVRNNGLLPEEKTHLAIAMKPIQYRGCLYVFSVYEDTDGIPVLGMTCVGTNRKDPPSLLHYRTWVFCRNW